MKAVEDKLPLSSRLLARLLDYRRRLDHLWLAGLAALPMALAAALGVFDTTADGFVGYRHRLSWTSLVLVLPVALFALRWIMRHIGELSTPSLPPSAPPVVTLIASGAGKQVAYGAFRRAMLAPRNLMAALLVTLVAQVADMSSFGLVYLSKATRLCTSAEALRETPPEDCAKVLVDPKSEKEHRLEIRVGRSTVGVEKDWATAYLGAQAGVGKWPNLVLNLAAYAAQCAAIFIGVLYIVLVLRHNLFFLSRIYQRRWVQPGDESAYIHIDLDDRENCFGFRRANDAFNVQLLALGIAAILMLGTRFTNVYSGTGLFPELGQALMVAVWVAGLVIISLPILVKLLPCLPEPVLRLLGLPTADSGSATASLVGYLREYLAEDAWDVDDNTPAAEVDTVAARFAQNAFWPTGNNRAWRLYFVSFWVFFIALVPDPRAVFTGWPPWSPWIGWILAGALAWASTWLMFRMLQAVLNYVDERLVGAPGRPAGSDQQRRRKMSIGLFISYRRADSAAYTGRLYDSLARHMDKDKVFMDLDTIPGGADFVDVIKRSIDSSQAMIVVIGPKWLSITNGEGPARLHDPSDFVHQEIALGLQRGLHVLPVLVGHAAMPGEVDLPDALKPLAGRNARELSDSRWLHDVGMLIKDLEHVK